MKKLSVYKKILSHLEKTHQQRVGQLELLKKNEADYIEDVKYLKEDADLLTQVQILYVQVSEETRKKLIGHIEKVVTAALKTTIDERMVFSVLSVERNTTGGQVPSVLFRTVTNIDGKENIEDPLEDQGGGSIDVICTALRAAILELYQPANEGALELDEVGKHLSAEKASSLAVFLKEYAAMTGRQILMITHNADIMAAGDNVIKVSKVDGWSEVES